MSKLKPSALKTSSTSKNEIVAEQMHECIKVKNPPNCMGGNLRILFVSVF
jgi:hypothetical protein